MYRPPRSLRDEATPKHPRRQSVKTSYALIALALLFLWTVSHPVAGVLTLTTLVSLSIVVSRAVTLLRCYYDCGAFALNLGKRVEVTVTRPGATG